MRTPLLAVSLLLLAETTAGAAQGSLDSLAGTWNDTESFVTLGLCASQPRPERVGRSVFCSPTSAAFVEAPSVRVTGFAAGTDSIFGISDSLRDAKVDGGAIQRLLTDYNYSDLVISSEIRYARPGLVAGIRPYRVQGQFQIHNPNLPLGSISYRNELAFFAGGALARQVGRVSLSAGVTATVLTRKETASEASLVDLGSKAPQDLLSTQRSSGVFFEGALAAELPDVFAAALVVRDVGGFWQGRDETARYLFIRQDRTPRALLTVSATPRVWLGQLQAGAGVVAFLDPDRHALDSSANAWEEQWFATLSYAVGPLRALSGFRPGLLRTGMLLDLGRLEASIAQEWVNQLELGRNTQPRFIVGLGVSI